MPTTRKKEADWQGFVRIERSPAVIEVIVKRHVELLFPEETWDVSSDTQNSSLKKSD